MKRLLLIGIMLITTLAYATGQDTLKAYAREYSQWDIESEQFKVHSGVDVTHLTFAVDTAENLVYTSVASNSKELVKGVHYLDRVDVFEDYSLYLIKSSPIGPYVVLVYEDSRHIRFDYWWDDKRETMNVSSVFDRTN